MNAHTSHLVTSPRSTLSRAQFSPLLRRSAARLRSETRSDGNAALVPGAGTLTPASPTLSPRWSIPNVLDRLQMPLSRIRE